MFLYNLGSLDYWKELGNCVLYYHKILCNSFCSIIGADASVGSNVISFGVALLYLRAVFLTSVIACFLHMFVMQQAGMKLGQNSLQAHGMQMIKMRNIVEALIMLALIGSVLLKKFAILLLR